MSFPKELANRVWHTTTEERFAAILSEGAILPEPNIPDKERWGTAMGSEKYPFVRSLGGVSLFDFRGFEEEKYEEKYPLSTWREFVPCRPKNESAIWIEIKLSQIKEQFIDGSALLAKWKNSGELGRKIMPLIECAHIGSIGIDVFGEVLVYRKCSKNFEKVINVCA